MLRACTGQALPPSLRVPTPSEAPAHKTREDILHALSESLQLLGCGLLQTITSISAPTAPVQFVHALAGAGKTRVHKCLIHGWNRIGRSCALVAMALETKKLRDDIWNDPGDILLKPTAEPRPSAASRLPWDRRADWG